MCANSDFAATRYCSVPKCRSKVNNERIQYMFPYIETSTRITNELWPASCAYSRWSAETTGQANHHKHVPMRSEHNVVNTAFVITALARRGKDIRNDGFHQVFAHKAKIFSCESSYGTT